MTTKTLDKANRLSHEIHYLMRELERLEDGMEEVKKKGTADILWSSGRRGLEVSAEEVMPILVKHAAELKQQIEVLKKEFEAL